MNCTFFSDGYAGHNRNHVWMLLSLTACKSCNIKIINYHVPERDHFFFPSDRMFSIVKCVINKNDRIYSQQNITLILQANEKFQIQRPQTRGTIDFKKWWPEFYKKIVLSVDSYGEGVPRDQKVSFFLFQRRHISYFGFQNLE